MARGRVARYDNVVPDALVGRRAAAQRCALWRPLGPRAPLAASNAAADLPDRPGGSQSPGEDLRDSHPLKSHPADGFPAPKSPIEPAAQGGHRKVVLRSAPAAKGCVKDRGERQVRFWKMHPLGTLKW